MALTCRGLGEAPAAALEPSDVVLGGGNVHKLKKLPRGSRASDANASIGGFRLWADAEGGRRPSKKARPLVRKKAANSRDPSSGRAETNRNFCR